MKPSVTYTGYDKAGKIKLDMDSICYTYGYDHQRIFMEEHVGTNVRTKRYVGNCEYVTETSGNTTASRWLTYLSGPTGVYAVVVTENSVNTIHYILKDNLGSWTTITNSSGTVEQRLSYDAWGNLRNPNTWTGDYSGTPMFDRGYTGHEHLYNFGLINMNGRMYDPVMSSFLSVDQYVSSPESAQGFNRYAYCMNNPLRYIDPSGWTMVNPVTGYTPNSATNANDPYAYCRRPLEPRDLGILQLPQSELNGTWMEGNERHGGGEQLSEPTPVADEEDPPKGVTVHSAEELPSKAFWHYQFGGKKDYWIDASTIDLNYISFNNLQKNKDGTYWVNLFEYSMTDDVAITLGKIHLIPIGENQYKIDVDKFDFSILNGIRGGLCEILEHSCMAIFTGPLLTIFQSPLSGYMVNHIIFNHLHIGVDLLIFIFQKLYISNHE